MAVTPLATTAAAAELRLRRSSIAPTVPSASPSLAPPHRKARRRYRQGKGPNGPASPLPAMPATLVCRRRSTLLPLSPPFRVHRLRLGPAKPMCHSWRVAMAGSTVPPRSSTVARRRASPPLLEPTSTLVFYTFELASLWGAR
jgi:hypothetical protein